MMRTVIHAALLGLSSAAACVASQPIAPQIRLPAPQLPIPPLRAIPISLKLRELASFENTKQPLVIPLFCDFSGVLEYEEPAPLGLIELFGSVDAFRLILSSDSVEVVELKPRTLFNTPAIVYADTKVRLPVADANALRSVLSSDPSFDWRSTPKPESGSSFRVTFIKDGRRVSLDVFTSARSVRSHTGSDAGPLVSIEYGYPVIAEIIERHFPGAIPKS